MKTKNLFVSIILFVAVLAIIVVGGISYVKNNALPDEIEDIYFGKYTFPREMTLSSGEVYNFYESGDEYFRYYHDDEGYVLIRDNDKELLTYAVLVDGVLSSSPVGFLASEEDKASIARIRATDIDFQKNKDLVSKIDRAAPYGGEVFLSADGQEVEHVNQLPLYSNPQDSMIITNLVILIKFNQTTPVEVEHAKNSFDPYFNSSVNSLKNYYEEITYQKITINSVVPKNTNTEIYVYEAGNREHYNVEDSNTQTRRARESELLASAVAGAGQKFDLNGKNLDINGDGYVDSVSFLICGNSSENWGGLLWPHSWNLDSIDGGSTSYIAGKKVGDYSFNFSSSINVGVLCHETGHVLGAPDLYHYDYDFVPVGKWDLMSSNTTTPQYMLTYIRDKYIGGIESAQIVDILGTGVYSLAPVSKSTSNSDVLAYKIHLADRPNEYFMIEYRNPNISARYDSTLPGTGLILYRVREPSLPAGQESIGNRDSKFQSNIYPDEVYVFRPLVNMNPKGTPSAVYQGSLKDIDKANLSPVNPNFRSIGKGTGTTKYDYSNIFYADGTNSKIVIEALSVSSEGAQFRVTLPSNSNVIPNDAFDSKISISSVGYYKGTNWAGISCLLNFASDINLNYLANVRVELFSSNNSVIATNNLNLGDFKSKYSAGLRDFECPFVVRDKGNIITSSFYLGGFLSANPPTKVRVTTIDAEGKERLITETTIIPESAYTWQDILESDQETLAQVFAGTQISAGIDSQGNVLASGSGNTGIWGIKNEEDVSMLAMGRKHVLVLTRNMKVKAYGENFYGEGDIEGWSNVSQVAAGAYSSYALLADGRVLATGDNSYYQLQVGSWSNIIEIAAGARHVVGINSAGRAFAVGDDSSHQCKVSQITNARAIAAGDGFTLVLHTNGEITIIGNFPYPYDPQDFTNITKIVAGARHFLALKADGRVVAAGENYSEQCNTSGLYDIVSLDAGEYHSIFMREDGEVEYRGYGNSQYETNTPMPNLVYQSGYISPVSIGTPFIEGGGTNLLKGGERVISVDMSPINSTYQRVIYTSSNENIVKINMFSDTGYKQAKIEGVSVGTATITARINGTNLTSAIVITVFEAKPVTGIAFTSTSVKVAKTKTLKLNYSLIPSDATNAGSITPTFTSNNSSVATVGASDGVVSGLAPGNAVITISITVLGKTYTNTCSVEVIDNTPNITVAQSENPIIVKQNAKINLSRITMSVKFGDEPAYPVTVTEDMFSSYSTSTLGSQSVSLTYLGVTTQVSILVENYVTKIEFVTLPKTQYKYNEDLSIVNGRIKATYSDQTTKNNITNLNVLDYSPTKLGTQTLRVKFTDPKFPDNVLILTYDVTVFDYVVSVNYSPKQTTYAFGSSFSMIEQLSLGMASNATRVEDFDSPNIQLTGFNSKLRGRQLIVAKYIDRANGDSILDAPPVFVDVKMVGSFSYEGKDDPNHYFEVNKDLTLQVYYDQGMGNRIEVTKDSQDLWFEIANFNKTLKYIEGDNTTEQTVEYRFFTKSSKIENGVAVEEEGSSFASFQIIARGLAPVTSWEIVKPNIGGGYVAVAPGEVLEYQYSTDPLAPSPKDLRIRKVFAAGGEEIAEAMDKIYDSELVGVNQPYTARYLNSFKQIEIKIIDIPQYIYEIPTQTVRYAESLDLKVYVHMLKRGKIAVPSLSYSMEFKNSDNSYNNIDNYNLRLGVQTVKITYVEDDRSFSKTFSLEIIDVYNDIEMITPPNAVYKYGSDFGPQTAVFRIHMRSGAYVDENYVSSKYAYSPEFNKENIATTQVLTIKYQPEGVVLRTWTVNCTVKNYIKYLTIIPAKTAYRYGDTLEVEVRAISANGANTKLSQSSYHHNYNPNKIGQQDLEFIYTGSIGSEFPESVAKGNLTVHVSDIIKSISIDRSQGAKRVYGYGEPLSFLGMVVTLKYESGQSEKRISDAEIGTELKITYNPTKEGVQVVQVEGYVGGAKTTFQVEVRSDEDSILKGDNLESLQFKKQESIVFASSVGQTLTDLAGMFTFADYLNQSIVDKNGTILSPLSTRDLRTGDRVVFTNTAGYKVYDFEVQVFGDANGDGRMTQSDLDSMAEMIIAGENKKYIMDCNGDGKSTLTDIVLFARLINGN